MVDGRGTESEENIAYSSTTRSKVGSSLGKELPELEENVPWELWEESGERLREEKLSLNLSLFCSALASAIKEVWLFFPLSRAYFFWNEERAEPKLKKPVLRKSSLLFPISIHSFDFSLLSFQRYRLSFRNLDLRSSEPNDKCRIRSISMCRNRWRSISRFDNFGCCEITFGRSKI